MYIEIKVTSPDKNCALNIAQKMLELRLVACAQVSGPIYSTFRWEGKINTAEEYLTHLKTETRLVDHCIETIQSLHPYDTPEIIATKIETANSDYLKWISESIIQE